MIHFDIEWKDLEGIGADLGATDKQVKLALSAALRRTASKLRMLSSKGLKNELDLRRVAALRKRLKSISLRKGQVDGVQLWFGLNDMPVSWFRGTPKQGKSGAAFKGKEFPGAFVGSSRYAKQKTVLKRTSKERLHIEEQLMPVHDQAQIYIEDDIFVRLEDIFWPLFRRDLAARVKYKIGDA
jgi:hypothetical protein